MVKTLHEAGIEVILDVVYNHTAEGNHMGPMLCFKGIDNTARLNLQEWFSQRLVWGILFGVIFGALMVQNVLSRPETEKITGFYLIWLLFWRGLIYGAIDGFLLTVFPWFVTWRAFNVREKTFARKIAFGFLAWVFILVMTTAYHLGLFGLQIEKGISGQYRKYHHVYTNSGVGESSRICHNPCDITYSSSHPFPQDRTFSAPSSRLTLGAGSTDLFVKLKPLGWIVDGTSGQTVDIFKGGSSQSIQSILG